MFIRAKIVQQYRPHYEKFETNSAYGDVQVQLGNGRVIQLEIQNDCIMVVRGNLTIGADFTGQRLGYKIYPGAAGPAPTEPGASTRECDDHIPAIWGLEGDPDTGALLPAGNRGNS